MRTTFIKLKWPVLSLMSFWLIFFLIKKVQKPSVITLNENTISYPGSVDKEAFNRKYHEKLERKIKVMMQTKILQKKFEADIYKNLSKAFDQCKGGDVCVNEKVLYVQNKDLFRPKECFSGLPPVAIIIPYRNRDKQLRKLLPKLHGILQNTYRCYSVFLVEQKGYQAFNKGMLNNAGFLEAVKSHNFSCFIFHDVDLVPVGERCKYECSPSKPVHMASAVDTFQYKLPYNTLVGGVIGFTPRQYLAVNGYSNLYWGWGLEDDDMEIRMTTKTSGYHRLTESEAKFNATIHKKQKIYSIQRYRRSALLNTARSRIMFDGVNVVKYSLIKRIVTKLFTHLIVDIGYHPEEFNLKTL